MFDLRSLFFLDPDIIFLNHGSFGAVPRPVFDVYQNWQRKLERQPVEFLVTTHPRRWWEFESTMDLKFQDGGEKQFQLGSIQIFAESRSNI